MRDRLGKKDIEKLTRLSKELRRLSTLEMACFSRDEQEDSEIKKGIKPYMVWFEYISDQIDNIII